MKLTYQTGIATLIQFISFSLLTFASQVSSVITTCHKDGSNCVSNLLTSVILYVLVAIAFGIIWIIGYGAQVRRSKRLAQLLICIEAFVALVAIFSFKLSLHHHKNVPGLATSFIILLIAVWVISLAWRLMRAGGGRVVTRQRDRKRPANS